MATKLLAGPFPANITRTEKEKFLLHFGAKKVIHVSQKLKEIYTIGVFNSHKDCEYALHKIHQIKIFGVRLSAKFHDASKQRTLTSTEINDLRNAETKEAKCEASSKLKAALLNYEAQLSSINVCYDVNHPISPKLRYSYPRATASVLSNIAHTLVCVPKFYTQVLHLMNKMNLPSPFGPLTAEPPLCTEAKSLSNVFNTKRERLDSKKERQNKENVLEEAETLNESESLSESELESDEEGKTLLVTKKTAQPKRIMRKANKINKKPRLETLKLLQKETGIREPKDDSSFLQEVFEVANLNQKRKLNIQNATTLPTDKPNSEGDSVIVDGFGKMYPQVKEGEVDEEPKQSTHFITQEELGRNRIPEAEWPIIPVFKNYSPGTPSTRLYIKNLSKTATVHDLRFIFGKNLAPESDAEASKTNVRLMKEGRMKGQAFLTFPSVQSASAALQAGNGYILKDKPMVIVFGKVKVAD